MTTNDDAAARARVTLARTWDGTTPPPTTAGDVSALVPPPCSEPVVSVITPCHDDGVYLLDALASVRLCAEEQIEMIVVDDASSEPFTKDLLERIATAGVTVVASQERGPAAARNAGLGASSAAAILPLDADNLLRPGFIPAALARLDDDPSVAAVHADAMRFGLENGPWPAPQPAVADLLCGNQLDTCAVIRREALEEVGGWDPAIMASEDWALWVALIAEGWTLARVPLVGFDYRVQDGSLRSTLTPQVRYSQLMHLVRSHPRIYTEHVEAVIANLAGAIMALDEQGVALAPSTAEGRQNSDHIAALEARINSTEAAAALARRKAAESDQAAKAAAARADEELAAVRAAGRADLELAEQRGDAAESHLAAFEQTKFVRMARRPRQVYARLQRRRGR